MEKQDWANLPDHIVVQIMLYIPLEDRYRASLTCKSWNHCFESPYLWHRLTFIFFDDSHSRFLTGFTKFGHNARNVNINLDQFVETNRTNSCKVLTELATLSERRLEKLKIRFKGENPLFYAGKEYIEALKMIFGPPPESVTVVNHLKEVDLSGLTVMFDENLLELLSSNNSDLEKLNVQNKVLVCKISPTCILNLVQKCRKLKELHIFMWSVSEDVLLAFVEQDREPLKILSLLSRREEKYGKDLSDDAWKILSKKLPCLRVTLIFDHTCPLFKINEILCPSIPVNILRLETFTSIADQVRTACRYYKSTLQKLVLEASLSKKSGDLNAALLELVTECKCLKSLHVFCVLEKETVEKILALLPEMHAKKSYTLKYIPEPHPWVAGKDCL